MVTRWTAVGLAAALSVGCGNEPSGGGPGNSAGASSGGSAGNATTGGSAGTGGSGGASGAGAGGAAGATTDPGLDCTTPETARGDPIPCNGACLADPGDENAGCRVLMRSFAMSSLVVDGDTVLVTDAPIVLQPDIDLEYGGAFRIAIFDRASQMVVGTVQPAMGRPHVRAVTPTQIAFMNVGDGDLTDVLRVAPRGTGEITESVLLDEDLAIESINNPREKVWFSGDTVYYQEYAVWGMELRAVPVGGGTITAYDGLVQDVVDISGLLVFGAASEFSMALQLYQLQAGAAATPVGMPLTESRYTNGYVLSDATSVYFLETTSSELTLSRTSHAGEALQQLGTYPPGDVVGSGQDGFVVHDGRYLRLIRLSGGEAVELADFGVTRTVHAAVLVEGALIVAAEVGGATSSYLLEIARP